MKSLLVSLLTLLSVSLLAAPSDTVVIELSNKSKIVIYTSDRGELKNMENYDINKMVKDLNEALGSDKIERIELEDENGNRYRKDTTIIIGEGKEKSRIQIGNIEILVDADNWETEDEEDEDFNWYQREKYRKNDRSVDRTSNHFNIDLGLNNWIEGSTFPDAENAPYALRPWGSWYLGFNSTYSTWLAGPLFLDWGFGANWFNFQLQNSDFLIEKGLDRVELNTPPATYKTEKSRLSVPYVNITMVPMLDFAQGRRKIKNYESGSVTFRTYHKQGIRIGAGAFVGYRLGGNSKLVYTEDGDKEKERVTESFYLSNIRYGARVQFGFKGLDLFATYDLNNVFAEGRGPAGSNGLNAIAFGITL